MRPKRPSDDEWRLAQQAVAKLTTDELRAVGAVKDCDALWPSLLSICFNTGPDRPFALD